MSSIRATLLLALIALLSDIKLTLAQPSSRILGGNEAASGAYPYVASLRVDGAHLCGCNIIGETKLLTAAHCLVERDGTTPIAIDRVSVRVGSINQFTGGKIVDISKIHISRDYENHKHDLAVLILKEKLVWTAKIASIALITDDKDEPAADEKVTVAGWGEQSSGGTPYKLHHKAFVVANEEECKNAFDLMDKSTMCLLHEPKQGSCHGDAGNGAVYNNLLVGISNFVVGTCGSRYPDVYSKVYPDVEWIQSL